MTEDVGALWHEEVQLSSVTESLTWFDLDAQDIDQVRVAARLVGSDAALAQQMGSVVDQLRSAHELLVPWHSLDLPTRFDPRDSAADLVDRWFYVVAYAACLPVTLAGHRARGIPESVSRATLADVGRHVRIARRQYGIRGFLEQQWLQHHLRGVLFDLGRLQFNLAELSLTQTELDEGGLEAVPGRVVVETHIPESGPMTTEAVDASFAQARPFFDRHFAELTPITYATCDSWLLDPVLQRLVPGSNIARFGARFRLFATGHVSDQSALDFVFRAPTTPREQLPRETRLQRGLLDHLGSGGHIEARYGWLRLPSGDLS